MKMIGIVFIVNCVLGMRIRTILKFNILQSSVMIVYWALLRLTYTQSESGTVRLYVSSPEIAEDSRSWYTQEIQMVQDVLYA